ncbi:M43 family zinc metalloprotease [Crocinitomix catalasitica]|uniref:M43 family zinc metalloprotease n=1 Tax=Crocinitomix catalasitica TaxID=184607 RepID=UPI000482509B|nr:M43 family zinc metalloprotease [Crocinitomix catalasitica]
MKKFTLSLVITLSTLFSWSQLAEEHLKCGSTEAIQQLYIDNPEFEHATEAEQARMQEEYEEFLTSWSPGDRSTYVVPLVVHVVHLGGEENISNEQIYNAIEQLNDDFNMLNDDSDETIAEFADIRGNCDIEFKLATKDPSGACHSGITRTYSSTTYDEGRDRSGHPIVEAVEDEHGTWPQNKYMNVFVCIDPNGAAGYTYNPAGWYSASGMDGSIYMSHDYMGIIGTGSIGRRHTLSHEVGHWLNLSHPWGGSNSPTLISNCGIDDGVDDTPNTIGWDNCSDLYGSTCGSLDNVQNIMDYSYCSTMFTEGQAARVQAALLGGTAQRYKLSTPANLAATGVDAPGELCAAEFSSNTTIICAGGSVDFSDNSFHTVTDRTWTFEGGTPSTSTLTNPTITYDTPGRYAVTLVANNGGSSVSNTTTNYITVLSNPGSSLPYSESFETLSPFPDFDRFMVEGSEDLANWEITSEAASHGSKSLKLENFDMDNGSIRSIISGSIDLSEVDPDDDMIFNFKYAYNLRRDDDLEKLKFYISKDCGETWAFRKNIQGDNLSEVTNSSAYTPASVDEWYQVDITNIISDYYVSDFRYKIEFENDNGNNIYIDEINMYAASMAGLTEFEQALNLKLFPNPSKGNTTLNITAKAGEDYKITVLNTMGSRVLDVYNGQLGNGYNTLEMETGQLATGIYLVQIESNNQVETIKLVKD